MHGVLGKGWQNNFLNKYSPFIIIALYAYVLLYHIGDKEYMSMLILTVVTVMGICYLNKHKSNKVAKPYSLEGYGCGRKEAYEDKEKMIQNESNGNDYIIEEYANSKKCHHNLDEEHDHDDDEQHNKEEYTFETFENAEEKKDPLTEASKSNPLVKQVPGNMSGYDGM